MYIFITLFILSLVCGVFNLQKLREEKHLKIFLLSNIFLLSIILIQSILAYKWKISIVGQYDFIFYVLFLSTGIILYLAVKKLNKKWTLKIYSGLVFFLTPIFLIVLLLAGLPMKTRLISNNVELREKRYILGGRDYLIIVKENLLFEREIKRSEYNLKTKSLKDKSISANESKLIFEAVDEMNK